MNNKIEDLIRDINDDVALSSEEELESGLNKLQDLQYIIAISIQSIREKIESNNKAKYNNLD
jgi:hypothetical protein